ncbi:MAG TPA: HAD family hydrolase [Anaerolineae bacterium]|nr:HAD family hydrolase [Anaerolineae bacterium]
MLSSFKGVFFDAGDTLITADPPVREVALTVASQFFPDLTPSLLLSALAAARAFFGKYYVNYSYQEEDRLLADMAQVMRTALRETAGVEVDFLPFVKRVRDSIRYRPFPDVLPTLRRLRERGKTLAVVSNWDPALPALLTRLGLAEFFAFILPSAEVGVEKPDGKIFSLALQRLGLEPQEVVHIGDKYEADVAGARAVGITPILLDRKGKARYRDVICISSLTELIVGKGRMGG